MGTLIDVNRLDPALFAGRTAIITGGASGIGLATGRTLHDLGCNVVLADMCAPKQYNEDPLYSSKRIWYQQCQVTSWESMKGLFEKTLALFGSIDIVCANAGVNESSNAFFSPDKDELQEPSMLPVDVNIKGTFFTVWLAMHYMKGKKPGGSIVMTASLAGYFPQVGLPLYTASKFAIVGFLRVMAPAAFACGIALSCVAPGMTETTMIKTLLDQNEITTNSTEERLEALFKQLRAAGIPSQSTEVVGKSIAYLAQQGLGAAGHSLYVQGGEAIELEEDLRKAMPEWLARKMSFMSLDASTWADTAQKARQRL